MRKLTQFIFFLCLIFLRFSCFSQGHDFEWVRIVNVSKYGQAESIITDLNGDVYISGNFYGEADFDPGDGQFNLTSSIYGSDLFIQKLNSNGELAWAKYIGQRSYNFNTFITTDVFGNIYMTGHYKGEFEYETADGTFVMDSNETISAFVMKLDSNGDVIWGKSYGFAWPYAITTDNLGNVFTTGRFRDTVDFDPNEGVFNLTTEIQEGVFIQKLDSEGNLIWAKSMNGYGSGACKGIVTDLEGNVYLTGEYESTIDFDPGAEDLNLTSKGGKDIFVQKLDIDGDLVWIKSFGSEYDDLSRSIIIDNFSNVYLTGHFKNIIDFDPSENEFLLESNGAGDGFILKLNSDGEFRWAKSIGNYWNVDDIPSITMDVYGDIYVTGKFLDEVDFDPGVDVFYLTSLDHYDFYILKLDSSGNFIWAKTMGGESSDVSKSITSDNWGNLYVTGNFSGDCDFDSDTANINFTSFGNGDIFVQKLTRFLENEQNGTLDAAYIFPNPNSGLVNIELGNLKDLSLKVITITGQLIYQKENINTSFYQFEINTAPGIYIIEISSNEETQQYKLVKK